MIGGLHNELLSFNREVCVCVGGGGCRGGWWSFVAVFQGLFGASHPESEAPALLTVSNLDLDSVFGLRAAESDLVLILDCVIISV